ncbi:MAG: hypothetical protein IIB02_03505 [Thaumarchaeota archaeon]|nr:hypothetical protein [Nitrososphaerota archaeon]
MTTITDKLIKIPMAVFILTSFGILIVAKTIFPNRFQELDELSGDDFNVDDELQ